jgi:hypothetical protein
MAFDQIIHAASSSAMRFLYSRFGLRGLLFSPFWAVCLAPMLGEFFVQFFLRHRHKSLCETIESLLVFVRDFRFRFGFHFLTSTKQVDAAIFLISGKVAPCKHYGKLYGRIAGAK